MTRIPMQITAGQDPDKDRVLFVLCNDGTIWEFNLYHGSWNELKDVPQPSKYVESETNNEHKA